MTSLRARPTPVRLAERRPRSDVAMSSFQGSAWQMSKETLGHPSISDSSSEIARVSTETD